MGKLNVKQQLRRGTSIVITKHGKNYYGSAIYPVFRAKLEVISMSIRSSTALIYFVLTDLLADVKSYNPEKFIDSTYGHL